MDYYKLNKSVRGGELPTVDANKRRQIDRLYLQMYPMLFEYARSVMPNDVLAEEAVQETFVIACQKPDALLGSPNPPGWLVVTLKHVISNTRRKQQAAQSLLEDYIANRKAELTAANDPISPELLYGDIARTEEFRLLKELAVDGRSYQQMARSRGISLEACRKRVQRAKEILRKKIGR